MNIFYLSLKNVYTEEHEENLIHSKNIHHFMIILLSKYVLHVTLVINILMYLEDSIIRTI